VEAGTTGIGTAPAARAGAWVWGMRGVGERGSWSKGAECVQQPPGRTHAT
jgi:hypothetical protein